jgi:hypothetical protein
MQKSSNSGVRNLAQELALEVPVEKTSPKDIQTFLDKYFSD